MTMSTPVGIAVGVEEADDGEAHLARLAHGVVLAAEGSTTTIAPGCWLISRMPREVAVILRRSRRSEAIAFFEYWLIRGHRLLEGLELFERLQAAADDAEVGQRATDPTLGDGRACPCARPASEMTPLI